MDFLIRDGWASIFWRESLSCSRFIWCSEVVDPRIYIRTRLGQLILDFAELARLIFAFISLKRARIHIGAKIVYFTDCLSRSPA